jgi:hypothetical protein
LPHAMVNAALTITSISCLKIGRAALMREPWPIS